MTQEQLEDLADDSATLNPNSMYYDHINAYQAGFKEAFKLILEKREEFGHGYLKGKLLDWILELK